MQKSSTTSDKSKKTFEELFITCQLAKFKPQYDSDDVMTYCVKFFKEIIDHINVIISRKKQNLIYGFAHTCQTHAKNESNKVSKDKSPKTPEELFITQQLANFKPQYDSYDVLKYCVRFFNNLLDLINKFSDDKNESPTPIFNNNFSKYFMLMQKYFNKLESKELTNENIDDLKKKMDDVDKKIKQVLLETQNNFKSLSKKKKFALYDKLTPSDIAKIYTPKFKEAVCEITKKLIELGVFDYKYQSDILCEQLKIYFEEKGYAVSIVKLCYPKYLKVSIPESLIVSNK